MKIWAFKVSLVIVLLILDPAHASDAAEHKWFDESYPYRVALKIERPISGRVTVDLPPQGFADAVSPVAVDEVRPETVAWDRARVVDPKSGKVIGRFILAKKGPPVDIDGEFSSLAASKPSPWLGFDASSMTISAEMIDGKSRQAMRIKKSSISNTKLAQSLMLVKNGLYLLDYYVWTDTTEFNIVLDLYDLSKTYFPKMPGSYVPPLTPRGKWSRVLALRSATIENPELRIENVFVGECGIAEIRLQPVAWTLVVETPPTGTDRLDVYFNALGGHLMVRPSESMIAVAPVAKVGATDIRGERQNLNPNGILVQGKSVRAWTVPSEVPLITEKIKTLIPAAVRPSANVKANLFRGGATTVLIAIETQTPLATVLKAECALPVKSTFERVAEIPLYDNSHPRGKKIGARYDALSPLNYDLLPPSSNGVHLVALTLAADAGTETGIMSGSIDLTVQTQEPSTENISIPIELYVSPAVVKPMWHFGTFFGPTPLHLRMGRDAGTSRVGNTVAEFHGLNDGGDELARKYAHRMIDFCVTPENPPLKMATCTVVDRGAGKAPELKAWDFSGLNRAIDEFILGRDMPWFMIDRSNGVLMKSLRLPNGDTYSFEEGGAAANWKKISRRAYFELVADYYEAIATHLDARGILDRTVYVVDESLPPTYPLIVEYIAAVKTRPHARRIRFGNTNDKTTFYTQAGVNGELMMDAPIDLPMPSNDEHLNYFEPEMNARMSTPGKTQWVYYVESTHFSLDHAGLSTIFCPLKLAHFGASGWYCWAATIWSWPAIATDQCGPRWAVGPALNPWMNPFYHHGPGAMSFFYPPDPRGLSASPNDTVIPSYRLALMRDGIQMRALMAVLDRGIDDAQNPVLVDRSLLHEAQALMAALWLEHPVQWHLSYANYSKASQLLFQSMRGEP